VSPVRFSVATEVPHDVEVLDAPPETTLGFEGRPGQTQLVVSGGRAVLSVGLGDPDKLDADAFRTAGACIVRTAWKAHRVATTVLDAVPEGPDRVAAAQALAEGAGLAAYRFSRYRGEPDACRVEELAVVVPDAPHVEPALARAARVVEAVCLARDLVNEPAGSLTPTGFAERAASVAEAAGLTIEVLDEAAVIGQRLGGLAGVARGSEEPPCLVKLTYEPAGGSSATVALVGKGVTFDSGGLSLKTADGMMTMKTDMSGAAAVLGAMSALPGLEAPVRVVGFLPLTENMPSGRAVKPGDVLTIRNGKTVEVLNTDAEGRLILADALALAAEEEPDAIVDLATLTGAQVVALGRRISGLMGNDDGLVDRVRAAARRAGEPAWPLPLPSEYRNHLDSEVADLKNIGKAGEAGTVVAGLFLQEFVGDVPWAHLDIAGPARAEADDGWLAKGGTGVGVRTLIELLTSYADAEGG
jgi:leucyl aminopeptidase